MARLPYTNFHDINLDWIVKVIKKAFTPDNPPPYPVKSVNGMTGVVTVTGDVIPLTPNNPEKVTDAIREKQDAPASPGTPGQVLGLDSNQTPVWMDAGGDVTDVKIDRSSIVDQDGVANIPPATPSSQGVVSISNGLSVNNGAIRVSRATSGDCKTGTEQYKPITPAIQNYSIFYGLAQAAGYVGFDRLTYGTYTDQAKEKIQTLLGISTPQTGDYAPVITDTTSGPVTSFPDGANDLDMLSLVAEIVPVQAGTGDPSPNNIRPISGRGGVTVYQTGENLFNKDTAVVGKWLNISTGAEENATTNYALSDYIFVKANQNYIITNPNSSRSWFYDVNKTPVQQINATTFNFPTDGYVRYTINVQTVSLDSVILALGTTLPTYTPFIDKEPILEAWGDIAGTVYGGTIDIVSGLLTITQGIVDISTLSWTYESNYTYPYFVGNMPATCAPGNSVINQTTLVCSHYKAITNMATSVFRTADYNLQCCLDGAVTSKRLLIQNNNYTSVESFVSSLTGVSVVYPLADHITYQLTPQEVQTMLGRNNIYSDSGDCSVTYRADTKLFILKVIA